MLKLTQWPEIPGFSLKNLAFSEGNKLFAGDFLSNLDEMVQLLIWFSLQRDGTGNGLSNMRILLQKACN